ncbi:MAG: Mo-dependent nitrogenase C-terminal domain-containing protein [Cyanobacteria bacterium P01_E01_bin.42]
MLHIVAQTIGVLFSSNQTSLSSDSITFDPYQPLRQWLNEFEMNDAAIAHLICRLIPAQCPFARKIQLLGWSVQIPPLCKLNPVYEEVVYLRFRALSYLADRCGEDIGHYC